VDVAKKQAPAKPVPAPLIGGKQQGGALTTSYARRNAPPDGRLNPPTPWVGKVERGSIYEHMPAGGGEFHFQYNPNEISYTFSFNQDLADPSTTAEIQTAGPLGGTSVGFEILLNRQYEVAYGDDSQGVLQDLDTLKYIVGMKDPRYNYMLLKTLKFVFGKDHVFYGFINSMSAKIAVFSEKMVPMFAAVQISALQMPHDYDPRTRYGHTPGTVTTQQAAAFAQQGSKPGGAPAVGGQKPSNLPARPNIL
jgi:hypothetical protein